MGLPQAKARDIERSVSHPDSDGGAYLGGAELLEQLESDHPLLSDDGHSGDPVKGIAVGLIFGSVMWLLGIGAYLLAA
jgi:hypothetical protein